MSLNPAIVPPTEPCRLVRRAGLILALLSLACGLSLAAAPEADEYTIKAAYLARFMEYVEWPVPSASAPNQPLTIGVLAPDPFEGKLEAVTNRIASASGRPLRIKHAKRIEDLADCDAIFVGKGSSPPAAVVEWVANRPILLIADQPGAIAMGFPLEFRLVKNTVRFAANPAAAKKLGLNLRARLLASALEVASANGASPVPASRNPPRS
ncbi:MAG: hypothetical protein QG602_2642 [Verrucomicrobiota bacterium]|nr:hypothetical protein [Verrucomicrobiota bacterium]